MCRVFIPLMSRTGRIVNISSIGSILEIYSKEIQERFRTARSLQDLEDLVADYEVSKTDIVSHHHFFRKKITEILLEMRK